MRLLACSPACLVACPAPPDLHCSCHRICGGGGLLRRQRQLLAVPLAAARRGGGPVPRQGAGICSRGAWRCGAGGQRCVPVHAAAAAGACLCSSGVAALSSRRGSWGRGDAACALLVGRGLAQAGGGGDSISCHLRLLLSAAADACLPACLQMKKHQTNLLNYNLFIRTAPIFPRCALRSYLVLLCLL